MSVPGSADSWRERALMSLADCGFCKQGPPAPWPAQPCTPLPASCPPVGPSSYNTSCFWTHILNSLSFYAAFQKEELIYLKMTIILYISTYVNCPTCDLCELCDHKISDHTEQDLSCTYVIIMHSDQKRMSYCLNSDQKHIQIENDPTQEMLERTFKWLDILFYLNYI